MRFDIEETRVCVEYQRQLAVFQAFVRKNASAGSPEQVVGSIVEWTHLMVLLEQRLADTRANACGATVADIVIGLSVNCWLWGPIDKPTLRLVKAYFRLTQRAAAKGYLGEEVD